MSGGQRRALHGDKGEQVRGWAVVMVGTGDRLGQRRTLHWTGGGWVRGWAGRVQETGGAVTCVARDAVNKLRHVTTRQGKPGAGASQARAQLEQHAGPRQHNACAHGHARRGQPRWVRADAAPPQRLALRACNLRVRPLPTVGSVRATTHAGVVPAPQGRGFPSGSPAIPISHPAPRLWAQPPVTRAPQCAPPLNSCPLRAPPPLKNAPALELV